MSFYATKRLRCVNRGDWTALTLCIRIYSISSLPGTTSFCIEHWRYLLTWQSVAGQQRWAHSISLDDVRIIVVLADVFVSSHIDNQIGSTNRSVRDNGDKK